MNFVKSLKEMKMSLVELEGREKSNLFLVCLVMFLLLFSYPLVRATTTAIFLNSHGAKASPYVWIYSVAILSLIISLFSWLQLRVTIHRLFLGTGLFTFLFFITCIYFLSNGNSNWAYPLYVWKEVYIVLLVHSCLGYLNSSITENVAKVIYGPFGAFSSLGGLLGGLLTSYLTSVNSVEMILIIGCIVILVTSIIFQFTDHSKILSKVTTHSEVSPLKSISNVRTYVLLIGGVVILSQFCINISNFQFNLFLEESFVDKLSKTHFLGKLYSGINAFSLGVQFLLVPFVLKNFSKKGVHSSIPIIFFASFLLSIIWGNGILPIAACFMVFKGLDYSLFAAAKEMLYFSLNPKQKYGAKYVVDMVLYRFSKGVISVILIYVNSLMAMRIMLLACLGIWFLLLIPLFNVQSKLTTKE